MLSPTIALKEPLDPRPIYGVASPTAREIVIPFSFQTPQGWLVIAIIVEYETSRILTHGVHNVSTTTEISRGHVIVYAWGAKPSWGTEASKTTYWLFRKMSPKMEKLVGADD